MLYNCIKIFHIISAALLLTSLVYSYLSLKCNNNTAIAVNFIQKTTFRVILPLALLQLLGGFTMFSLKQIDMSELWVSGSLISFIVGIGTWLGYVYSLVTKKNNLSSVLLWIGTVSLLSMIFFMTTRMATIYG